MKWSAEARPCGVAIGAPGDRLVAVIPEDRSMVPPTSSKLNSPHGAAALTTTPLVVNDWKSAMR